jgi:hypothetical protein
MFQVAMPLAASALAKGAVLRKVAKPFVQQPPWITTATGNSPLSLGRRSSPNCSALLP